MNNSNFNFEQAKKILVVRLGKIGDIVVTSFVFDVIKMNYPSVNIYLLTLGTNKEVLKYNSQLENVFYLDKNIFLFSMIIKLRKEKFDLILDFNDNPSTTSKMIFKYCNAKINVGYNFEKHSGLINKSINQFDKNSSHIIERMTNYLEQLNLKIENNLIKPVIFIGEIESSEIKKELEIIKNDFKIISINISAGAGIRYWSVESWIELIDLIITNYKDVKVLIHSTEKDLEMQINIFDSIPKDKIIKKNYYSIQHFAAYIKFSDILISPDTSAVHIASAVGTPVIALFPNYDWNYASWQPFKVRHRSVKSTSESIKDISPAGVFNSFNDLYKEIFPKKD